RTPTEAAAHQWVGLQPDRIFISASRDLIDQVKAAGFRDANESNALHPPADLSFKETALDEANVQFTFVTDPKSLTQEENDKNLIRADIDLDLFKDPLAHGIFEVFPNGVFKTRTDPRDIYVRRWVQSRFIFEDFDPLYVMTVG